MKSKSENSDIEKSKAHVIVEIIEYIPDAVVSRTIIKKTTGNVTVSSFAAGEEQETKSAPFDTYVQIIDGTANLKMEGKNFTLKVGEGIIIPAFSKHCFTADMQFKMLSTVIKSGYESD